MEPVVLSDLSTFLYGCLGGLISYVAVFALPELRGMWQDVNFVVPDFPKLVVALLILVGLVALGGGVAVFVGDAAGAKQAIAYGLGAEGIVGGVIRGATE